MMDVSERWSSGEEVREVRGNLGLRGFIGNVNCFGNSWKNLGAFRVV